MRQVEPVAALAAVPRPTGALERFRARNREKREALKETNFSPVCYLATMCWNGFQHDQAVENANLATTTVPGYGASYQAESDFSDRLAARVAGFVFLALSPIGIVGSTLYRIGRGAYFGFKFLNRQFNHFWYGE